jgi:hypothetical protein
VNCGVRSRFSLAVLPGVNGSRHLCVCDLLAVYGSHVFLFMVGEEPDKRLVAVDFGPGKSTLGEAES